MSKISISESKLVSLIKNAINETMYGDADETSALDSDYFGSGIDPNTKEGYLKLLFSTFVIDKKMNANDALQKAMMLTKEKFG